MTTQKIDLCTFGATPAAMYLVRILNERNPGALRACAVRARSFNTNVNQIEQSVAQGSMTAHTAANLLRLLRTDATTITLDESVTEGKFIAQLLRNVIIGNIKRAIRAVSTLRKIENNNVNLSKVHRKGKAHVGKNDEVYYTILGYPAGVEYIDGEYYRQFPDYDQIHDDTTPELLMERSNRRCLRQHKPHMMHKGN